VGFRGQDDEAPAEQLGVGERRERGERAAQVDAVTVVEHGVDGLSDARGERDGHAASYG